MSVDLQSPPANDFQQYRIVSKAAVFSLLIGLVSLPVLVFPTLLVVPFGGLVLGVLGWRRATRQADEYSGRIPAFLGVLLCGAFFAGGASWHSYVYATEVPPDALRISFSDLQPRRKVREIVPPAALELDGQRVFIKGYVHPGVASLGKIKRFVLVPDMGTCCFGGQPKLTDMVEVTLVGDDNFVKYNQRKRKLAGTLRVTTTPRKTAGGLEGGLYVLEADYVQ